MYATETAQQRWLIIDGPCPAGEPACAVVLLGPEQIIELIADLRRAYVDLLDSKVKRITFAIPQDPPRRRGR